MNLRSLRILIGLAVAALLISTGCGSSSSAGAPGTPAGATGAVHAVISDDPTEDWATIGVKVLNISLVPQGGGTPVAIYTAPSPAPFINLVQLDQLGEIIGNASVPQGTYSAAKLTLSANPGDVLLVTSGDPEASFNLPAGYTVPSANIAIMGATGGTGSLTVPLTLNLAHPLTVNANTTNALDLEFDLKHPALLVEHLPAGAAPTAALWAVNFNGPLRHHAHPDLTKLLLRHLYGQVVSVSADNTYITVDRAFPTLPIANPETATVSTISVPILADATNGTIFYDLDTGGTPTPIYNFQNLTATLPNDYVRIAARYQQDGTLVATRILASQSFAKVWKNPEGHVLHVNTTSNVMWITTEDGGATELAIGPETNFYFQASNVSIGTGPQFFDGLTAGGLPNLARGFKVSTTIDPASSATPPVALSVDIEVARYDGAITQPTSTGFNYTRNFAMADGRGGKDDYAGTLDYISSTSTNTDQQGGAIEGFYWWDFTYPTLADTGANAVSDFESATGGSVDFGGVVGPLKVEGLSRARWNDPAAADSWAAEWTLLMPVPAPIGSVTTAFNSTTDNFTYTVPVPASAPANTPAALPVTVDLSAAIGSATLVYQVDRQGKIITITPQDISNSATLATVAANLVPAVPVKVFGVPQADGSIKAYVLLYYTHTASTE